MADDRRRFGGFDHVELWVGNAKQAAYYYRTAFGFSEIAYRGLETGWREGASYVLAQGKVRLVVTSSLSGATSVAKHHARHGDGVRDVAFAVDDVDAVFETALARGMQAAEEPHDVEDDSGKVRRAAIHTYGDTVHGLLCRAEYSGPFLPGYVARSVPGRSAGLTVVDHVVGNVEPGRMEHWASVYAAALGFHRYITFDDRDISTEHSALRSVVMRDESHAVKLPINEPAEGRRPSQIQEYLDFYDTPGVQHVALLTRDIVSTVSILREGGVEFLQVPGAYYEGLQDRVGPIDESVDDLRRLGILVDRDEKGYLLQLFTKPLQDRPTLFFEVIQRRGAQGFGKGNFKALFEAIEREQQRRGNL